MFLKKVIVTIMSIALIFPAVACKKQSGDTIKIGALFAVTGPASFLGAPEANTAKMLVEEINAAGGINGKKIDLIIKDTGSMPEKAVALAKQLVDEEKVIAIIGPSTSGESMQVKGICESAKTILLSCAAAEVIVNPIAKYVFKTPQNDSHAAERIFDVMKSMKISQIGILSSSDGFGKAGKDQLEKIAPKMGITVLISEVYDKNATDLTGALTKLSAKKVQAVVNWSIVPAQSIIAKNMKQINLNVPLFQSHGFGNIKYAKEAGKAGEGIIFPCGRLLIADILPEGNKQKLVLMKYKKDYEGRFKEDVSTFGGHAHDAIMILVEGLKKGGTDTGKVRDAIEGITGFAGTAGIFNFSKEDHCGLDVNSFEMLTVKDGKFVPYSKK